MAEAAAHPRDVFDFLHGEAQDGAFLDALGRGRLHHAWLLTGPEGVGKATFAYRAARRLLGAAPAPRYGPLGSEPDATDARLVSGRAHPDLIVLDRDLDDPKVKKVISVDAARALPEFFSKAPSRSKFRVAIVDAVDDMNVNAANALLKTLEEPPERGVLFLVSHSPGRLLATIRSRCRRLVFRPWSGDQVIDFLRGRGLDGGSAERLAIMAKGSPGRALALAQSGALDMDEAARALVTDARGHDPAALLHLADGFKGKDGQGRFELFFDRLAEAVRARAGEGGPAADRWAALWEKLAAAPGEADAVNLDRADVFWSALADVKALAA
jgi:DNA polymerase-3 subunit delta'